MTAFNWTPDRVETLKTLWAEGQSCSQIARHFGCGLSRNAVIGKVHQLGLERRRERAHANIEKTRDAFVQKLERRKPHAPLGANLVQSKPLPPVEPALTGNEPTLTALTRSMCRFPVGEATGSAQMFCGAPTEGVYCPYHRATAYSAAPPPRERVSRVMGGGGRVMR